MLISVYAVESILSQLVPAGLLLFLCYRTRSKGLILISVALITSWIFDIIIPFYSDHLVERILSNESRLNMNAGEFIMLSGLIISLLYDCLYLLGGYLCYREWRQGKFRQLVPAHQEESSY